MAVTCHIAQPMATSHEMDVNPLQQLGFVLKGAGSHVVLLATIQLWTVVAVGRIVVAVVGIVAYASEGPHVV